MAELDENSFDDPGLKAAVRRLWGAECAPDDLRRAVETALTARDGIATPRWADRWRIRSPLFGLAAAAIVLLAVGLTLHFGAKSPSATPTANPGVATVVLPADLASQLVARHDECCRIGDEHRLAGLAADPNNFDQLRQGLRHRLGFPILSAALPGNWHFNGASICPVGPRDREFKSGHLVFQREGGKQFVSLFSLSPHFLAEKCTGEYAESDHGHALAGFVTGEGFYCVCGSSTDGSLTLDDVRRLRDQLRPDVATASSASGRLTVAQSH